jgi:hypothetical protein
MIMKIILHVINAIRDGPDDVLLHNYRVMVFNATFNNISAISWGSVAIRNRISKKNRQHNGQKENVQKDK